MRNKLIMTCFAVFAASFFSFAQFSPENKLLSGGISFAYYGNYNPDWDKYNLDLQAFRPIILQFEAGMKDKPELGDINGKLTYGIFLGFNKKHYFKDEITGDSIKYTVYKDYMYVPFGLSFALHYNQLLTEYVPAFGDKRLDLYVSMKLGFVYEFYESNYEENPLDPSVQLGLKKNDNTKFNLSLAPQLGCRFYVTPEIAAFGEIGYNNLSVFTLGLTYKFNKK